jgi:hypothetical protein
MAAVPVLVSLLDGLLNRLETYVKAGTETIKSDSASRENY